MRKLQLFVLFAAALVSLAPGRARACNSGGNNNNALGWAILIGGVGGVGAAVFDIGFTIHDVRVDRPSLGAGVFETLGALPQFGLLSYATVVALTDPGQGNRGAAVFTGLVALWTGALTAHGIWSIANAASAPQPIKGTLDPEPRASAKPPAPTAALSMTYVPVGQLSAPGFGVVGRF